MSNEAIFVSSVIFISFSLLASSSKFFTVNKENRNIKETKSKLTAIKQTIIYINIRIVLKKKHPSYENDNDMNPPSFKNFDYSEDLILYMMDVLYNIYFILM